MKRYKPYAIEFGPHQWFHYFSVENKDGNCYDAFLLRLPIWGYGYSLSCDSERWGQRILQWHGKHGFSLHWDFPQISSISVTPEIYGLDRYK